MHSWDEKEGARVCPWNIVATRIVGFWLLGSPVRQDGRGSEGNMVRRCGLRVDGGRSLRQHGGGK